jgi:polyisoprenoid-binding protein YceI
MKKISISMLFFAVTLFAFTACKNEKTGSTTTEENVQEEATSAQNAEASAAVLNPSALPGDTYTISTENSRMNWRATKVGGKHNGTVAIQDGFLKVQDGNVTGGTLLFDMNTITVLDLEGEWKDKLERHLKGLDQGKEDHFFNVEKYPVARFDITKVTELEGSENGNHMIYGDLTIKGKTNPVGMTAMVKMDGNMLKASVNEMVIDRTLWDVNYNSKKIFSDIQDNIIHDEVKFDFGITAEKA